MHSLQMAYACLHVHAARWSINSLFVFHTGVLYGLYVPPQMSKLSRSDIK